MGPRTNRGNPSPLPYGRVQYLNVLAVDTILNVMVPRSLLVRTIPVDSLEKRTTSKAQEHGVKRDR